MSEENHMTNKRAERPSHSEAQKRAAVLESRATGNTVVSVAKKYGVSANTVHTWRKAYPQTGALPSSRTRIVRAQRTTIAAGGNNAELIQMLKQDLAATRAENRVLRDIFFEQEFKHRGLGATMGSAEMRLQHQMIPEGTQPNGSISATN
jgi:transposase-like protein